jgi:hypothetical protein
VSSFPSISIPRFHRPIPSISMPTYGSFSDGGTSISFSMEGGNPSTFANPMRGPTSSGVGVPFRWNISSGFGVVPSHTGASSMLGGFKFPYVSTPFPWGNFFTMGRLPLC